MPKKVEILTIPRCFSFSTFSIRYFAITIRRIPRLVLLITFLQYIFGLRFFAASTRVSISFLIFCRGCCDCCDRNCSLKLIDTPSAYVRVRRVFEWNLWQVLLIALQ